MMFPVNFYYSLVSSNLGTKTILMIKTNITFVFLKQDKKFHDDVGVTTAAGLEQSVERLTAECEVAGSIPGAGSILRILK